MLSLRVLPTHALPFHPVFDSVQDKDNINKARERQQQVNPFPILQMKGK